MRSLRALTASLLAVQCAAADAFAADEVQKPVGVSSPSYPTSQDEAGPSSPFTASPKSSDDAGLGPSSWYARLNYSSPAPHLFASAYGLLQQWSNTVFPNGHTMAAVEVPAFTLFYHGRMDEEDVPSPEWLAFDIEMAYGIMGSTRQSFMLTYQTTRPVKALYFDGESAALMGLGQLDTQMLHLYGNVSGPQSDGGSPWRGLEPEYERAMGLCDWLLEKGLRGPGWGFEGVVRMNTGFEMIWCDFGGGGSLRLVGRGNVTAPQLKQDDGEEKTTERDEVEGSVKVGGRAHGEEGVPTSVYPLPPQPTLTDRPVSPSRPPMPPNWRGIMGPAEREPFLQTQGWGWFASATWHYGSNGLGQGKGETRARVLGCGITSWYADRFWGTIAEEERARLNLTAEGYWSDRQSVGNRSEALAKLGRRRRMHHLENVTAEAAAGMRWETEVMLRDALVGEGGCSGMEWVSSMGEIVQRTAGHLMVMEEGARFGGGDGDGGDWGNVTAVREWLYKLRGQSHMFLVSFLEYPGEIDRQTWDVRGALFAETYSRCRYRYTRLMVDLPLSVRERDLRDAVEEVMGGICGVLLEVGFGVERAWYDLERGETSELKAAGGEWADGVRRLRAWVGWEEEFIRCREVCGWDERCYIPMWPLLRSMFGGRRPRPPPEGGPGNGTEPGYDRPPPPPYRGRGPGYGGNHTGPPGRGMPGRSPIWMGDETDLWEPKCVQMEDIMPRTRGD
ncbi:putative serine protein [Colletotrichum scovillei]|uniref:Serine protein n=1 Tax=Colletotrichum scovillei TaxID=1209932 RepID=A0A9P7QZ58_9PEZI|nr:putative serine protein [Colletotrichum scovillei]KAG7049660.1 putative serine protein [Colletotrichum scovillei]KAG7064371.1 putative serine protein [Colletotrichum scovillei]